MGKARGRQEVVEGRKEIVGMIKKLEGSHAGPTSRRQVRSRRWGQEK